MNQSIAIKPATHFIIFRSHVSQLLSSFPHTLLFMHITPMNEPASNAMTNQPKGNTKVWYQYSATAAAVWLFLEDNKDKQNKLLS
jgi:hypothetical protein